MSFRVLPMKPGFAGRVRCLAQAGVFALISGVSFADDPSGYIYAEGIGIYFAVMPAEVIQGYAKGSPEFAMHGGPPAGTHQHHVMVALFEGRTLERITDAKVEANVAEIGLAGTVRELEPMPIAGALTYGNYFYFTDLATYRITIEILRTESAKAIKSSFEYKHH